MASNLQAMASNLLAMASNLVIRNFTFSMFDTRKIQRATKNVPKISVGGDGSVANVYHLSVLQHVIPDFSHQMRPFHKHCPLLKLSGV